MIDFIKTIISKMQPEALLEHSFKKRCVITFFAGALCTLALPPFGRWPLFFIGFTLFYFCLLTIEKPKQAFLFGWLFGLGYFLFGLNWIGNALLIEGNDYWWVWPLAVIALPIALALFTGLCTFIAAAISFRFKAPMFYLICIGLALSEFARGTLFTGFPWNLYSHIWIDVPVIAQAVSLIGSYGLTFITLVLSGILIALLSGWKNHKAILFPQIIILAILTIYGTYQLKKPVTYHEGFQVQIVQPNIAQADKWDATKIGENFNKHIALSEPQADAQRLPTTIIWPETAIGPSLLNSRAGQERISRVLSRHPKGSLLLTGTLRIERNADGDIDYFNTVTSFTQDGNRWPLYSKSHLVPFGEYIPFQNQIPIKTITQFSGFAKGDGPSTIKINNTPAFSPFICYETIFPKQVANNKNRPEWLLNVTNDAWYGKSPGPYQHFAQSRLRAIEQGLPFVRSANTGISGLIDPFGRVIAEHELMTQGLIITKLPKAKNQTLYSKYGEIAWLLLVLLSAAFVIYRRQSRV